MLKLASRSRSLLEGQGGGRSAGAKASDTHVPDEPRHDRPGLVSEHKTPSYNGVVHPLPADICESVHRYASRPLPATPSAKSVTIMAERPSTSGGLSSRKQSKKDRNFDKRISRDDFYLDSRTYGDAWSLQAFAPKRDQFSTPSSSPRSRSTERFVSSALATVNRQPIPEAIETRRHEDIGMALGSPSHTPGTTWNNVDYGATRSRQDSVPAEAEPSSRSSSVDTIELPSQKKPGKWKLFGMFGRKHSDKSVTTVSITNSNGLEGTHHTEEYLTLSSHTQGDLKSPGRSNTTKSCKTPRHKPIIVRSQTMPLETNANNWDRKQEEKDKKASAPLGHIPIALDTAPTSNSHAATGPLLNVEIPEFKMERYSIMFNSVLNSHPTLLTRRQANVPKLKVIEDVNEHEEEERRPAMVRRATSPQPTKSLGFALFPANKKHEHVSPHRLSPLARSNTLPSPSKPVFDRQARLRQPSVEELHAQQRHHYYKPPEKLKLVSSFPTSQSVASTSKNSATHSTTTTSPTPAATSEPFRTPGVAHKVAVPNQFSNGHSNLILESPTEVDDDFRPQALKSAAQYVAPEPKWQMMSPSQKTPSTASSNNTTVSNISNASTYTSVSNSSSSGYMRGKASPATTTPSSSRTQITPSYAQDFQESQMIDMNTPGSGLKMTPVELSIARQINLSRQQRKLLQPLRTTFSPAALPDSSPTVPPGRAAIRKNSFSPRPSPDVSAMTKSGERIAETKTATPTLVHPPESQDQELVAASKRRSEVVVLEGGMGH
ncbi:hypothetical protein F5Y16DRAFT_262121 [Xylariaceae sp. FL0255]|nr:hypothetical protein F5Y16DRAFT_262121 [Xylariaceae sp. FL0255]